MKPYKEALVSDGIPAHSFQVQDLEAERKRLGDLGVEFTIEPMDAGPVSHGGFRRYLWEPYPTRRDDQRRLSDLPALGRMKTCRLPTQSEHCDNVCYLDGSFEDPFS